MLERLAAAAPAFVREFGNEPRFRIAMHCGVVVAGELGDLKREISFSGDAVNTTARIEAVAKLIDCELVVSADLIEQIPLPASLSAESLGVHALAGKAREVELYAVVSSSSGTADDPRNV